MATLIAVQRIGVDLPA